MVNPNAPHAPPHCPHSSPNPTTALPKLSQTPQIPQPLSLPPKFPVPPREALLAEMGVALREDGGTVGVFSPKKASQCGPPVKGTPSPTPTLFLFLRPSPKRPRTW